MLCTGNVRLAGPVFMSLTCDEDGQTVPPTHELTSALQASAQQLQAIMPVGEAADQLAQVCGEHVCVCVSVHVLQCNA